MLASLCLPCLAYLQFRILAIEQAEPVSPLFRSLFPISSKPLYQRKSRFFVGARFVHINRQVNLRQLFSVSLPSQSRLGFLDIAVRFQFSRFLLIPPISSSRHWIGHQRHKTQRGVAQLKIQVVFGDQNGGCRWPQRITRRAFLPHSAEEGMACHLGEFFSEKWRRGKTEPLFLLPAFKFGVVCQCMVHLQESENLKLVQTDERTIYEVFYWNKKLLVLFVSCLNEIVWG